MGIVVKSWKFEVDGNNVLGFGMKVVVYEEQLIRLNLLIVKNDEKYLYI